MSVWQYHCMRRTMRCAIELVPINRKYPLEELIPACKEFIQHDRRRKITWEYVMLDGVNDSIAHAKALIRLLQGVPSKVNLIPFNPFPGNSYRTSPPDRVEAFRQRLKRAGIISTTRKTRGDDIDAACGQLVGKVRDRSRRQLKRIPIVQEIADEVFVVRLLGTAALLRWCSAVRRLDPWSRCAMTGRPVSSVRPRLEKARPMSTSNCRPRTCAITSSPRPI